ncbi:putative ribonuclease H-like domain-containing protein [Tanacetum coccineum]
MDPTWYLDSGCSRSMTGVKRNLHKYVEQPSPKIAIGSKWVFRNKKDELETVIRFKARLAAQGFSQVEGIDYVETFARMARMEPSRYSLPMLHT